MLKVIILSLFLASLSPKPTDTTDLEDTWAFKTSDSPLYQKEGCFSVKTAKTGVYLGTFSRNSFSTVDQCAQAARKQDFTEFALFEGGLCKGGHDLQEEYNDQGSSLGLCKNDVGGKDLVVLYSLKQTGR